MFKIRVLMMCSALLAICSLHQALAAPQDFQNTMLMAAGQAKEVIENGAAARDSKGFEIGGMKFQNTAEVGFGDAMKHGPAANSNENDGEGRRRKRATNHSSSSSSSSSSESGE